MIKKTAQGLLKDINPQTDSLEEFQKCCKSVLLILRSGSSNESHGLKENLDRIIKDLREKSSQNSLKFLDYLTEADIMEKMADCISLNLRQRHAELMITFFTEFLTPEMSQYIHHMAVHKAITKVIASLDLLNWKCPRQVACFVRHIYTKLAAEPVTFELLMQQEEGKNKSPIIEFLALGCTCVDSTGRYAREFIEKMFFQENDFQRRYGSEMREALYPVLLKLFVEISGFAQTIDFKGSIIGTTVEWCDRLFQFNQDFEIEKVYEEIVKGLSLQKKLRAMAFWLDHIVRSDKMRTRTLNFCIQPRLLDAIGEACESHQEDTYLSAFDLLLLLLNFDSARRVLLPPYSLESIDIMNAVPKEWQVTSNPHESISKDIVKVKCDRPTSSNIRIYGALIEIYRKFGSATADSNSQLTKIISLFYAWAPDLINMELLEATKEAYSTLENVGSENAKVLLSFVRDVHNKFISAPKEAKEE